MWIWPLPFHFIFHSLNYFKCIPNLPLVQVVIFNYICQGSRFASGSETLSTNVNSLSGQLSVSISCIQRIRCLIFNKTHDFTKFIFSTKVVIELWQKWGLLTWSCSQFSHHVQLTQAMWKIFVPESTPRVNFHSLD